VLRPTLHVQYLLFDLVVIIVLAVLANDVFQAEQFTYNAYNLTQFRLVVSNQTAIHHLVGDLIEIITYHNMIQLLLCCCRFLPNLEKAMREAHISQPFLLVQFQQQQLEQRSQSPIEQLR